MILVCFSLFGAGCSTPSSYIQRPTSYVQEPAIPIQPAKLPANFERRSVSFKDGRDVDLIVVRLPNSKWAWSMHNDPQAPKKVSAWRQALKSNLVINASYFTETNQPSGFYKIGSKNKRVKLPKPGEEKGYTGLIGIVDGKLELGYLPHLMAESRIIEYDSAFLSFPTLMAGGKNMVDADSGKLSSRTALAQNKAGDVLVIMTEKGSISLFELAQWLESQPENFQTAINLDGGPSSGISYSAHDEAYGLPSSAVPNILSASIINTQY